MLKDWPERCCSRLSAPSLPWEELPGSSAGVPGWQALGCGTAGMTAHTFP